MTPSRITVMTRHENDEIKEEVSGEEETIVNSLERKSDSSGRSHFGISETEVNSGSEVMQPTLKSAN
jgi:hypothetical protein